MAFLLGTCLISEIWKPRPNAGVMAWLGGADEAEMHLSVLCLGELRKVIGRVPRASGSNACCATTRCWGAGSRAACCP